MTLKYEYNVRDAILDGTTSRAKVFNLIKPYSNVLDIGCYTGEFGALLQEKKNCTVDGIEMNVEAASKARIKLRQVFMGDIERGVFDEIKERYDILLFLDVLEHLRQSEMVLQKLQIFLKPTGYIIITVPNIANWWMRKQLLLGNFTYTKSGLLDETHLRFFTIKSVKDLIRTSGYNLTNLDFSYTVPVFEKNHMMKQFLDNIKLLSRFPGFFAWHIIAQATLRRVNYE